MTRTLETLIEQWDGLAVLSRYDGPTGSWIFVALHDDTLGPPTGGTRVKTYDTPADGLRDAMRLAEGMTHKWASIGFGCGGGKAVLAVPRGLRPEARRGLLLRYARIVEALHGGFATGRDLGTSDDDMRVLAEVTAYVHGVDPETGAARDPGPYTAAGVLAAIQASATHAFGSPLLQGRRVLVQGVGGVGTPLAQLLVDAGATLMLSDLDSARATELAVELGAETVHADAVYDSECDVYAPCAVGQTLNARSIPWLRCKVVAGSANNQLEEPEDAERLHERGILYAPDFIANGGGALAFGMIARGQTDADEISRRLAAIGDNLTNVYADAAERGESPLRAAQRRVEETLGTARAARSES